MLTKKWILSDFVSQTHSQSLKASLYSYFNVQRPIDSVVPPGYHLIYFNPKTEEESLSKDGYDTHQQPPDLSFKRRMWIGGSMKFHASLPFNQRSHCIESISNSRKLKENHYVTINRQIITHDSVVIEEERSLIYTNSAYTPMKTSKMDGARKFSHELTPTQLLLFRYSALTFNSHKIHYDKEYALLEGYPTVLMQGPLSVTLLLEWVGTLYEALDIREFKYKNVSPIFVDERIRLCLRETTSGIDVWIEKMDGSLLVGGSIITV